jgi:hypothetical protein
MQLDPDDARATTLKDRERVAMAAIRDELTSIVEEHRRECSNPHCVGVANMLAFLAHCTGLTQAELRAFPRLVFEYELHCRQAGGCCEQHKAGGEAIDG